MQAFIGSAKVMTKGQVTIPKDIREVLGVSSGGQVTFILEGDSVRVVNAAVYAMQMLQMQMNGAAEKAGIVTDEDVLELVRAARNES